MNKDLDIAKLIDHTLLSPDATEADIKKLCDEAKKYGFFSVCVHPSFIKTAREMLSGTEVHPVRKQPDLSSNRVKVTTVIGFPLGMTLSRVKIYEAMEAVILGADELDMVINTGNACAGKWDAVRKEISDLVTATPDTVHKIIIETCYLRDEDIIKASIAAMEAGAEFIKTSSGFAPAGAVVGDVGMIKQATKGKIGIKAAGGIKTLSNVLSFVEAGATRIGTSSGTSIMKEVR
ncbi:deoxyribose-phosphate aldolase [bacterium BMS3Abin10]|nr:deoxyribose-phosphate aldolase [bacterium BMS3Abin10]GBE37617.1 deoxyribose-phosphate aldolase [bacterium BMS3Bbin08]HDH50420.1 deoxyribose-phosphate aldolase [Nitrospirota bacterium]HDK17570.1 deoxyribose-phosphate aldolase [Nitrospirota bacterium]